MFLFLEGLLLQQMTDKTYFSSFKSNDLEVL